MKKKKRVKIVISSVLLIGILILDLYHFMCIKVWKKSLATVNGYALLEVISSSMSPTIEKGDYILIHTKEKSYHKNDIITFYDKDRNLVTHRIVSVSKDGVITKGDFNRVDDSLTVYSDIVGKYVFKIPSGGKIGRFLRKPAVMILVIIILFSFAYITVPDDQKQFQSSREYQEFLEYLENGDWEDENTISSPQKKKKNNNKKRKKRAKRKQQRG